MIFSMIARCSYSSWIGNNSSEEYNSARMHPIDHKSHVLSQPTPSTTSGGLYYRVQTMRAWCAVSYVAVPKSIIFTRVSLGISTPSGLSVKSSLTNKIFSGFKSACVTPNEFMKAMLSNIYLANDFTASNENGT